MKIKAPINRPITVNIQEALFYAWDRVVRAQTGDSMKNFELLRGAGLIQDEIISGVDTGNICLPEDSLLVTLFVDGPRRFVSKRLIQAENTLLDLKKSDDPAIIGMVPLYEGQMRFCQHFLEAYW